MPLRGFHRIADAETGETRTLYFGRKQRAAFVQAAGDREHHLVDRFNHAGWRVGTLAEEDGAASLFSAFGVPYGALFA